MANSVMVACQRSRACQTLDGAGGCIKPNALQRAESIIYNRARFDPHVHELTHLDSSPIALPAVLIASQVPAAAVSGWMWGDFSWQARERYRP